jgi:hypothetical protein
MRLKTPQDLTRFLASQPASGGEKERLRQGRILASTSELAQSLEQQRLSELKTLQMRETLNEEEARRLRYLRRLYPEEASNLQKG